MSTYTLSGVGTHALSAATTALHVTINTPGIRADQGRANPANFYQCALLRFGDGTGWWAPIPVQGGPQWIPVPAGSTIIGYNVFGAASVTVAEVIGGSPPFGTPSISLEALTDASIISASNGDVLTWVSADSKWENKPLSAVSLTSQQAQLSSDVSVTSTNTFFDGPSLSLVAGTWLLIAHLTIAWNGGNAQITYRLWNGTTTAATLEDANGNTNEGNGIHAIITIASTQTWKVSIASNASGLLIKAATPHNPQGNNASTLSAIKLA